MFFQKAVAFIAILYLVKQFLWPFFRPASGKQKQKVRKYAKDQNEAERKRKARERKLSWARTFAKPFMTKIREDELKKILYRLNMDKKPEEVLLEQGMYLVGGIIIALIAFSANSVLGLIAALFIPLGWFYPTDAMYKEVKRKNKNVELDFPEFYSMAFYQYSKSVNIFLSDVIKDYLPNANDDMAEELGVMLDNIEYADEDYALKQLKKRIPIHCIIKFCDIMETRLRGYDNVSQMQYFKNEIDRLRITELEIELAKRVQKNNVIQLALVGVLVLYVVIYFIFTILGSIAMFQ